MKAPFFNEIEVILIYSLHIVTLQGDNQLVTLFAARYVMHTFIILVHLLQQHIDLLVGQKAFLFDIQDAKSFRFVVNSLGFLSLIYDVHLRFEKKVVEAQQQVEQTPPNNHQISVEVGDEKAIRHECRHERSRPAGTVEQHQHVPHRHTVISKVQLCFELIGVKEKHSHGRVNADKHRDSHC